MNRNFRKKLQQIETMMNHGDFDYAVDKLKDLCRNNPDSYYISSLLGECYLSLGEPEKAVKPLRWAARRHSEIKKQRLNRISKNKTFRSEKDTVRKLRKHFHEKSKNPMWVDHYLLGCAYGRSLKFANAIRHFNIANRMNPENSEVIRNIGWIRCMQKKNNNGRKLLQESIRLDPDNALAYNDLGASYMFEEKLEEADKWISQALILDPNDLFILQTSEKLEELRALKTLFNKNF